MSRAFALALAALFVIGNALAGPEDDYNSGRTAYLAGDVRAAENPSLTAVTTSW